MPTFETKSLRVEKKRCQLFDFTIVYSIDSSFEIKINVHKKDGIVQPKWCKMSLK
jgi:hypothetical protein